MRRIIIILLFCKLFIINSCSLNHSSIIIELDSVYVYANYLNNDTSIIFINLFYSFNNTSSDTILVINKKGEYNSFFVNEMDTIYFVQDINCFKCDTFRLLPKSNYIIPFRIKNNSFEKNYVNLFTKAKFVNEVMSKIHYKVKLINLKRNEIDSGYFLIPKSSLYYIRFRNENENNWGGL